MARDYAGRARALVGTRFRPQGRGSHGLDCIGLVLAAFDLPASAVRRDYRLRGDHRDEIEQGLNRHFRRTRTAQPSPGDVMLMAAGAGQLHLGVQTDAGFVHAHAGIGRVVETPGRPEWAVLGIYRRRSR